MAFFGTKVVLFALFCTFLSCWKKVIFNVCRHLDVVFARKPDLCAFWRYFAAGGISRQELFAAVLIIAGLGGFL
jgi:hypothetical protein